MKMGIGSVKLFDFTYNFPSLIIIFVLEMVSKFLDYTDANRHLFLLSYSTNILNLEIKPIFSHLLMNQYNFFSSFQNKISFGIINTFIHFC